jgi:hypothetical protein
MATKKFGYTMARKDIISREKKRLLADYQMVTGSSFQHFFCPILLEDIDAELCMGHVVNKCIPNSSRKKVLQTKAIDGFFGSLVEKSFSALIAGKEAGIWRTWFDKNLSQEIRPVVTVDGAIVPHYIVAGSKAPQDPVVKFVNAAGEFIDIALKISPQLQLENCDVQLVTNCDYLPEATATLIKAAHLTMFKMIGYKYVFHGAGYMLAKILQRFYLDNRNRSRQDQLAATGEYFAPYAGIIIPLEQYNKDILKGTIDDRRVISCIGSSGHPYSMGVLVRTKDDMHIIFIPPDNPDNAGTYDSFVRRDKSAFMAKIYEFCPPQAGQPAKWQTDAGPPIRMQLAPQYRDAS